MLTRIVSSSNRVVSLSVLQSPVISQVTSPSYYSTDSRHDAGFLVVGLEGTVWVYRALDTELRAREVVLQVHGLRFQSRLVQNKAWRKCGLQLKSRLNWLSGVNMMQEMWSVLNCRCERSMKYRLTWLNSGLLEGISSCRGVGEWFGLHLRGCYSVGSGVYQCARREGRVKTCWREEVITLIT